MVLQSRGHDSILGSLAKMTCDMKATKPRTLERGPPETWSERKCYEIDEPVLMMMAMISEDADDCLLLRCRRLYTRN
jgi:hypothetical protein